MRWWSDVAYLALIAALVALWMALLALPGRSGGWLICLALWPTVYVFTHRGFEPLVSPAMVERCMTQLWDLHAGRFYTVTL